MTNSKTFNAKIEISSPTFGRTLEVYTKLKDFLTKTYGEKVTFTSIAQEPRNGQYDAIVCLNLLDDSLIQLTEVKENTSHR